jgi:hypothetical protein
VAEAGAAAVCGFPPINNGFPDLPVFEPRPQEAGLRRGRSG